MTTADGNSADDGGGALDEDEDNRAKRLWELYDKLLAALLRECAKPDARASMLNVARQFLRDNHVSLTDLPDLRAGLAALVKRRTKLPLD